MSGWESGRALLPHAPPSSPLPQIETWFLLLVHKNDMCQLLRDTLQKREDSGVKLEEAEQKGPGRPSAPWLISFV